MNQPTTPARFVLVVAVDATPDAEQVLSTACAFARSIAGAEIHVVHTLEHHESEGFPVAEAHEKALARARGYLDEKARQAQAMSGVTVIGHLREADPARAILQTAASVDADLLVVGTHDRRGLARWAMGVIGERVTRDATCPVLVVRPKGHSAARAPQIEPPCSDCLRVQRESHGATLWCARHAAHHPLAHVHYETPEGFGAGSGLLRPS